MTPNASKYTALAAAFLLGLSSAAFADDKSGKDGKGGTTATERTSTQSDNECAAGGMKDASGNCTTAPAQQ